MIELSGAIGGGAFDREWLITANSGMITGKPLIGVPKRSHKICANPLPRLKIRFLAPLAAACNTS